MYPFYICESCLQVLASYRHNTDMFKNQYVATARFSHCVARCWIAHFAPSAVCANSTSFAALRQLNTFKLWREDSADMLDIERKSSTTIYSADTLRALLRWPVRSIVRTEDIDFHIAAELELARVSQSASLAENYPISFRTF